VKQQYTPLLLALLLTWAGLSIGPARAQQQQHGVTILRGESSDQLREGKPDMGIRRTPANPAPRPQAAGSPPADSVLPIARDGGGNGVVPPSTNSEMSQALTSPKTLSPGEAAALAAAFKAVDENRFADARAAVANFNNPLLVRIVEWTVLRVAPRKDADFASTWRFLREYPDWPEPEVLRRQAEDRLGPETPTPQAFAYFTAFPPLTSAGHMKRLAAAQSVSPSSVPKFASESWRTATFKKTDEEEFLNKYSQHLSGDDQIARFDRILRGGRAPTARELMPKLPPEYQPVAEARLAMATKAADATTVLRGVPAARLAEPTIKLEQLAWLRRTGNFNEAKAIALQAPANQNDSWWNERQQLARDMLAAGHAADAYAVVVPHGQTKGIAFAEAEFLAGWIALRHLKKPVEAQKHFQTLLDGAPTDFSRSRAAYWLGRTHEAANRQKEAMEWFSRAAGFGQTFYGQIAARKLPGGSRQMPSDPVATNADEQALAARELVTVARYIGQSGDSERTRPFLLQLARLVTGPGETLLLARLASELKRPDVALVVAQRATASGVTLFDASFPVVNLGSTGSVERALALALTRQESGFNAAAVSSSGALGLMQLLPSTAREVAGKMSLPFVQDKLTSDPQYNVALGSQYLAQMLQRFGGSYELALAAYNAGPGRVARWLDSMGDPRAGKIDMVDWIEMIPFRETRNYVQSIMGGVGVYRERLNGPFTLQQPGMGRS